MSKTKFILLLCLILTPAAIIFLICLTQIVTVAAAFALPYFIIKLFVPGHKKEPAQKKAIRSNAYKMTPEFEAAFELWKINRKK